MISIGKVGKIIITKNLKNQIDYYHKQNPGKEWSGILFFKQTNGDIEKLKDLEFTATNVYLMDIGSETFTSFKIKDEIVKAYEVIGDKNLESLTGLIHSHQNMTAFFSGTDIQELKDNAKSYYFYISLVVSTTERYVCKIIIPTITKIKSEHEFRNNLGELKKIVTIDEKEDFLDGDLEIEFEETIIIPEWVKNRIFEIIENKKSKEILNVNKQLNFDFDYNKNYNQNYNQNYKYENFNKIYGYEEKNDSFNKTKNFAVSIIMLDSNSKISIEEAIKKLCELNENDFSEYLYALSANIYDLYDYIYPDLYWKFDIVIKETIKYLNKYKNKNKQNLNTLIKFLDNLEEDEI